MTIVSSGSQDFLSPTIPQKKKKKKIFGELGLHWDTSHQLKQELQIFQEQEHKKNKWLIDSSSFFQNGHLARLQLMILSLFSLSLVLSL